MAVTEAEVLEIGRRLGFGRPAIEEDEASARSAVSRGYYAAFHSSLGAVRDARSRSDFDPGHAEWAHWLRDSTDVWVRALGTSLEELRLSRVSADYKLTQSIPRAGLLFQMRDAEFIVKERDELRRKLTADRRPLPGNRKDRF